MINIKQKAMDYTSQLLQTKKWINQNYYYKK
jgi:hypothetical protein